MSFFSATNITAGYDKKCVVNNVSFELDSGCLMGILGANGSGKTTLLKAICGILPHEGSCLLENCCLESLSVRQIAKRCSYIPQRSGISIDVSVLDVVLMGFNPRLGLLERPTKQMRSAAQRAIEQVGLAEKAYMNYQHLSEGQKQLCILARTLVAESRLLLLDEPESALDFRFRYRVLALLRNWIAENQTSAIVTLHDPVLALNYCDKLLIISDGNVLGTICPAMDSLETMEQMLCNIYGPVSLQYTVNRTGRRQLIMLNEETI